MLRLKTKLRVNSRVEVKCDKHPRYNPEKEGRGGIRGACTRCEHLFQIFNTWQTFQNALRDYTQMTVLYEKVQPRAKKPPAPSMKEQLGIVGNPPMGDLGAISDAIRDFRKKK